MRQRSSPIHRAARRALLLLLLLPMALAGAAFPASATAAALDLTAPACRLPDVPPSACDNPLPQVLNIGLPFLEGVALEELEKSLRSVLGPRYEACALCPGRPLRINVALGSDYQVLDWLDRGLVDMAVVPVLGFELLHRDGLDLLEIADPAARAMEQLVGRVPRLTRTVVRGGEAQTEDALFHDLFDFAAALWACEGEEECASVGTLVMPSHLSTAGFLMPVLTVEQALESLPGARDATIEERQELWRKFYDRVCFRFGPTLGRRDGTACALTADAPRLEVTVVDESSAAIDPYGPPILGPKLAYRDRLVIRGGAAGSVFASGTFANEAAAPDELDLVQDLLDRTVTVSRDGKKVEVPKPSAFDEFLRPDGYFGTRTFAFRVGETLDLIDFHQRISSRSRLSLVLPGGGVKAAYQSRVLDALYGLTENDPPFLQNVLARGAPAALPRPGTHRDDLVFAAAGSPLAPDPGGAAPAAEPLAIDSVVGTSGGALLGFFVARLSADSPGELSKILWQPGSDRGSDRYLTATEIFGWTDLPRYVSLVLILCIFGAVLAVFSWRRTGFLSPEKRPEETPWRAPSVRPALWLTLALLLGATPLVVRWVSGGLALEHVPEFEGLLYAVLLVIGMFADQCLVKPEAGDGGATGRSRSPSVPASGRRAGIPPVVFLAVGGALVAVPFLLRFVLGAEGPLQVEVHTGSVYLPMALLATGFGLVAGRGERLNRRGWVNVALWLGDFVVGTALALGVLRLVQRLDLLRHVDRTPLLFLALFGAILVAAVVRLAQSGWEGPQADRWRRYYGGGVAAARGAFENRIVRFVGARAISLLGCLIALDLTRPEAKAFGSAGLVELFTSPSKLHAPYGALAVCMGAVLLLVGTVLALHRHDDRYRIEGARRFGDAVLLVVTGLALSVYLGLVLTVWLVATLAETGWFAGAPWFERVASLTLFELTPAFWLGLAAASLIGSAVLVRWAWVGCAKRQRSATEKGGGPFARWLCHCLAFLCSVHPNAHLVPRRVVRLGLIAIGGLFWWNFVLAPGLYGNRYAFDYMMAAQDRFERAHGGSAPGLTARFLAPANALAVDGTRFVLAIPESDECPAVPVAPGVTWRRFRAVDSGRVRWWSEEVAGEPEVSWSIGEAGARQPIDSCFPVYLRDEDPQLQSYIFASGSPFPAFPPKRVSFRAGSADSAVGRPPTEALVDGGYSNNVPIEAAAKLGASQALVIHSSNPRPGSSGGGWLTALGGPLVDNLPRLLGFLYERSQQLDRRSRSDLFVASLAPPPADDWPILTDFRASTVKRMIDRAGDDLDERIGMVESWGPPEFQSSLRIPVECAAECREE